MRVDALNRRLNYEVYLKLVKFLLKKEGQDLRIIKVTEENKDIIKKYHDNKIARYLEIYKIFKRI